MFYSNQTDNVCYCVGAQNMYFWRNRVKCCGLTRTRWSSFVTTCSYWSYSFIYLTRSLAQRHPGTSLTQTHNPCYFFPPSDKQAVGSVSFWLTLTWFPGTLMCAIRSRMPARRSCRRRCGAFWSSWLISTGSPRELRACSHCHSSLKPHTHRNVKVFVVTDLMFHRVQTASQNPTFLPIHIETGWLSGGLNSQKITWNLIFAKQTTFSKSF